MTKQQILDEAMRLDPQQRVELIDELRQTIDDLSPDQRAEIRRRGDEIDRGEVQLLDGDEVMRRARAMVQKVRRP